MFFKILPISKTGVSAAYILATVHFLYPKLGSFSDMEYYFYQLVYRDSKVPKRFVGLIQIQCSPSFDCNWGKQNDPTACWHQLHQQYQVFYSKGNVSATHRIVWAGSLNPQIVWAARGLCPLQTPLMRGRPPLKFPPCSIFRAKGGRKTINFLSHFHWLIPDTNYKYLECFVMLGTHSELHRGQMSHIHGCDISALRVKSSVVSNIGSMVPIFFPSLVALIFHQT